MPEPLPTDTSLHALLAGLDSKPAAYMCAARQIDGSIVSTLTPMKVAVISSFTAEVLRPYFVVEGARRQLYLIPHFCPFNQLELQVLNPGSELYQSQPNLIFIALRLEEIAPNLIFSYAELSKSQIQARMKEVQIRLYDLVNHIRRHSRATVLLCNFGLPLILDAGLADPDLELSQSLMISRLNEMLNEICHTHTGIYVFDTAQVMSKVGLRKWYDSKLFFTARIPFSWEAQLEIGKQFARYVNALLGRTCKCLVLDLDNTLWGGVLGEDGIQGIELGEDYPGNVFKHFQRRLLSLRSQGILLAIASKNNRSDVIEVFDSHPDILLKLDDFSASQIHWSDKVTSLKAIATELNIGLDALAFFDDSPIERSWVRENLAEVTVIEAPNDPIKFIDALEDSGAFDRLLISADDLRRADMMQQSQKREQFRTQSQTVEEFLQGLDMIATVGKLQSETLPRVVQLLAKTNQFNLTTRRHLGAQLQDFIEKQQAEIFWMRIRDRFGDNGLVGVIIGIPEDEERWHIESFLLSCRVIGRQAETVLLALLAQCVSKRNGKILIGEYIPTMKNRQVAELYARYGFKPQDESGHFWCLDLTKNRIEFPAFFQIEYNEGKEAL